MKIKRVIIQICEACLDGEGEECHTPGCAFFLHAVSLPIHPAMYKTINEFEVNDQDFFLIKMRMGKFFATVEAEATVKYTYTPGHKGARDSLGGKPNAGPPLEPDDPPEIEIVSVNVYGRDIEIDDELRDRLEDEAMAHEADRADDYPED